MANIRKVDLAAQYAALVDALTNLADADVLVLDNQKLAKADVLVALKATLAAAENAKAAGVALKKALADEAFALEKGGVLRAHLKSYLHARFGKRSPELVPFGFEPEKTPVVSVEAKHTALTKRAAKRKAGTTPNG